MKKLTLIFLLSASLIFASDKDGQNTQHKDEVQNAEQEYINCIEKAEKELNRSEHVLARLNPRDFVISKNIYNRYNQQCNKCLTTYAFNQARTLLKLFLKK